MFKDTFKLRNEKNFQSQATTVKDTFKDYYGIVSAWIIEDEKVIHHSKKNTIVTLARGAMALAISDTGNTGVISHFKLGTGGHVLGDILTAVPAVEADVDLEVSEYSQAITTFVYSETGDTTVTFQITVEKADANVGAAYAYNEAGLFTNAGATLFSRDTFPAMIKTPARKFYFEWSIVF
jgi:hypothetical protein